MNKIIILVLLLSTLLMSCNDKRNIKVHDFKNSAVLLDEELLLEEERPDFNSPMYVDKKLKFKGLPEELEWYTSDPGIFGSKRAKQGGSINLSMSEYPQTFRVLGPNSNGGARSYLSPGDSLVTINSETMEWIPQLATHWAFSEDNKTIYFKLNESAKWNDGVEVTSDDYLFLLEMMRSKHIKAPWYNNRYTNDILEIKKYGKYLISITGSVERGKFDLLFNLNQSPKPKHHYNGIIPEDFIDRYQWVYEPTTGPYTMSSFKKGESITFTKVNNWWGYTYRYNKYRFNIDTINLKVISGGLDIQKQYFLNGETDIFGLTIPREWAESGTIKEIEQGYIERHSSYYVPLTGLKGIVLNTQRGIFRNKDIRTGLYYALNIQKMIDTVLRGEYKRYHNIGYGHYFSGENFDDDSIKKPDFNPVKAEKYFIKAGYTLFDADGIRVNKSGKRLSFELTYSASFHTKRLSILKEEAKKAGLEIILNNLTEGAFTLLLEKKHEAFYVGMSTNLIPLNWQFFHSDNAKSQTNNFFMIKDDELDRLVMEYKNESDVKTMSSLNKQIQNRVHDLALVVPTSYVPFTRGASWKWVRYPSWLNVKYNDIFMDPLYSCMSGYTGYNWIDSDIKSEVIRANIKGHTFEPRTYIDRKHEER